ncbi:hypothetical protein [Jatrophihabitans endophyticus]|uniref:hypothetical protein n=1 Tax=Jatrophihabitans endophyticus TaxID=1206085 RepID=UPI001A0E20A8|nr:hypothetical protein [Jatrophihabitans endophyticus]MBE7187039.1 hypothetical protein [Jatrophihabitans endophyticus]
MEQSLVDALRVRAQQGRRAYGTVAQRRERARSMPARVVLPVVLAGGAQVLLILGCLALGFPTALVVACAVALAIVSAVIHRRTVGSLIAGAGIRVAQPYVPGEQVRLFVPTSDAVVTGEIVRVGPANTTLMIDDGLVRVPNSRMFRDR